MTRLIDASSVVFAVTLVTNQAIADGVKTTDKEASARGYTNKLNRLYEKTIDVKDQNGKLAVIGSTNPRRFSPTTLKIVWTSPSQFSWNYSLPELHNGKSASDTVYPSISVFLKKKWQARKVLRISIPDTSYALFIVDGEYVPLFYDSEKDVLWQLTGRDMQEAFRGMTTVSSKSRRIQYSAAGGDCVVFLTVDFSSKKKSPRISYYLRQDGF